MEPCATPRRAAAAVVDAVSRTSLLSIPEAQPAQRPAGPLSGMTPAEPTCTEVPLLFPPARSQSFRMSAPHGIDGLNQSTHVAVREGSATVSPRSVSLDARRVIGDERPLVADLSIGLHRLEQVQVALVEENLGVLRHLAAHRPE